MNSEPASDNNRINTTIDVDTLARVIRPDVNWDYVCESEDRDVQIAYSIPRDNARAAAERILAVFVVTPRPAEKTT